MMLRGGALSLCLLGILTGVTAGPQCVVFTPGLMKSGESGKACLLVTHHTEPMNVDVSVEVDGTKTSIFKEQIPPGDVFKCSEFLVPKLEKPTPVFFRIEALSGTFNYTQRQPVVVTPTSDAVFMHSDKYNYKAGQTVHIYLLKTNNNLQPVEGTFSKIYVMDQKGSRLREWRNQTTQGGILGIDFEIPGEPDFGLYSIVAEEASGNTVSHNIMVKEYSLPKYYVSVMTAKALTILDQAVKFDISSTYTYGQPVPGNVSGRICRPHTYYYAGNPCSRNPDGICVAFTGELDSKGYYKGNMDLTPFQFDRPGYAMNLKIEATVIEYGSGVQVTESKNVPITQTMGTARFDRQAMLNVYKKGLPFLVAVKVEDGTGQPQKNQTVAFYVDGKPVQNLTSDENGRAYYELDTSEFGTSQVQLQLMYSNEPQCYDSNWVVPSYSGDYFSIGRFFALSESFVQIQKPSEDLECGSTHKFKVRYIFGKNALEDGQTTSKLYSMIMTKAKIVYSGEHPVDLSTSRQGEFDLTYTASAEDAPNIQLVVMMMTTIDLVADTAEISLEKCFKNPVSVNFSSEMGTPGSNVDLTVKATPESVCIARVADSSLLLMDRGQTLTPDRVYGRLHYLTLSGYNYAGYSVAPPQPPCITANNQIIFNSTYYQAIYFPNEQDTGKQFQGIGLLAMTDTPFEQRQLCNQPNVFQPPIFARPGLAMDSFASGSAPSFSMTSTATEAADVAAPTIASFRYDFPEMWLVQLMTTGQSGSATQSLVIPGTITTWNGDAICLSNQTGFGMSKHLANFTSFQMMFVDVSAANHIVRGESMRVVASVAFFLDKCAKVQVSLEPSTDYTAEAVGGLPVKCVCSQERAVYSWNLNVTSLDKLNITVTAQSVHIGESCEGPPDPNEPNRKDTVVHSFSVAPEGVKQTVTQTKFICTKGENSEHVIDINPTGNIVPGSLKATVQVIGDILGPALVKPETLFDEPTGCGEQNLAKLMPIIAVLDYLTKTVGVSEEEKSRATLNIQKGYMTQMKYRNPDGSFSAFGGGSPGSSWLTIKTLKTMSKCKRHILVDESIFKQGSVYLASLQDLTTGSFKPQGMLFNQELRGGADDHVSFTCEVATYLLENPDAMSPTILPKALTFLEEAAQKEELSVYNLIMLMNVFKLSGNTELFNELSAKVKALAIEENGKIHWEPQFKPKPQTPNLFSPPASSGETEMTAIALKTYLLGENSSTISEESLGYGTRIALWLVEQQRAMGAYRTTVDTVQSIDALTDYAALTFQKDASNTVQLKKGNAVIKEFTLDPSNRHLLQSEPLQDLPGQYNVAVSGNGCAVVQAAAVFYVPFMKENSAFSLSVTTSPNDCQNGVAPRFPVHVNVSYEGSQNRSNMAITDIPVLSGHSVDRDSLSKLKAQFPMVEIKNDHLIIYHSEMGREVQSFTFTLERDALVSNFQDKTATTYDYYVREENGNALIKHPCTLQAAPQ